MSTNDADPDDIPEEELGAAHDAAMERAIECEAAADQLREMHVELDGIADGREAPIGLYEGARDLQSRVSDLAGRFEEHGETARDLQASIRERIESETE